MNASVSVEIAIVTQDRRLPIMPSELSQRMRQCQLKTQKYKNEESWKFSAKFLILSIFETFFYHHYNIIAIWSNEF